MIGSLPEKSPRPIIYWQSPPRPAAAQAEQMFTGKLSAGGDFFGGDPIMGRLFIRPEIF